MPLAIPSSFALYLEPKLLTVGWSISFRWLTQVYSFVQECLHLIGQETAEKGEDEHSSFNQILRVKAVHYLAFFILVYVGVEVTIGGMFLHCSSSQRLIWRNKAGLSHLCSMSVVGVLLQVTSRQVFSGVCLIYWAASSIDMWTCTGLMVGRILLLWINRKVSCCDNHVFLIPWAWFHRLANVGSCSFTAFSLLGKVMS